MYKANFGIILLFGVLTISFVIFIKSCFYNEENQLLKFNYSYRGIKLIPENAPQLNNLFDGNNNSHNTFTSSSECLKCHGMGMKIKGRMQAPQIAHNIIEYCVSCHALAKNEK